MSAIPWLDYLRLGRLVYRILRAHFPDLGKVPIEDLLAVVEELLKTTASVQEVAIQVEPPRVQGVVDVKRAPAEYRLVVTGRGPR
jgi:hypothetical protein